MFTCLCQCCCCCLRFAEPLLRMICRRSQIIYFCASCVGCKCFAKNELLLLCGIDHPQVSVGDGWVYCIDSADDDWQARSCFSVGNIGVLTCDSGHACGLRENEHEGKACKVSCRGCGVGISRCMSRMTPQGVPTRPLFVMSFLFKYLKTGISSVLS